MNATEFEMGTSFETYLKTMYLGHGSESSLIREFEGSQGIPDFVVPVGKMEAREKQLLTAVAHLQVSGLPKIIALLENKPNLNKLEIAVKSGLSVQTVEKALRSLLLMEVVEENESVFSLTSSWTVPELDFWAFELKLSNWKRAAFQSLRYQTFAAGTIAVFPKGIHQLISKNISQFERFGLGIIIFDAQSNSGEWLLVPEKRTPKSRTYYLSSLFYFLRTKAAVEGNLLIDFPISAINQESNCCRSEAKPIYPIIPPETIRDIRTSKRSKRTRSRSKDHSC